LWIINPSPRCQLRSLPLILKLGERFVSRLGLVVIVAVTLLTAIVFAVNPKLDLTISAMFFEPLRRTFPAQGDWFLAGFRFATSWVIVIAIAIPSISLIGKMLFPARPALVPGRAMLLILLSIAIGPGLLVNAGLKEHWNRPRPGAVKEFGGPFVFKPWWDASGQCRSNCSFVSGESAAAFAMLAPATLVAGPWRVAAIGAAMVFGTLMALLRVVFGGHFFTDVVFAGALSALLVWLLHGWLYRWMPRQWSDAKLEQALADTGYMIRDGLAALGGRFAAVRIWIVSAAGDLLSRAFGPAPRRL
jgi:lipid A 4'-phosphatase